jgi:flap endonuclease-1
MGIKYLSSVLRETVPHAIKEISMCELKGKKIAVDVSIYMYRFLAEDALLENMYLMISLFRKYDIIPIFIFDGYPSDLKYETILERKHVKESAKLEYNELINTISCTTMNNNIHNNTLRGLKRKLVTIKEVDFKNVKQLMTAYGVLYYDAPSEADNIIAKLAQKKIVWGVLSDDTDYFAYGCQNILRYLSLTKESMVWYDMRKVLTDMNMTQIEFREICVLSGTDYNKSELTIYQVLKYYDKYKRSILKHGFYTWLDEQSTINDYNKLITIYSLYENKDITEYNSVFKKLNGNSISFQKMNIQSIKEIMSDSGFIFV